MHSERAHIGAAVAQPLVERPRVQNVGQLRLGVRVRGVVALGEAGSRV